MEELTRREIEDCQSAIGVLLDERTSGLDEKRWNDLWDKLERMAKSLPNKGLHPTAAGVESASQNSESGGG